MPTSELSNIAPIIKRAQQLQPRRIADLGIGCGKYGALLREYLEVNRERISPDKWQIEINGYEAFPEYMNPMWDMYTKVFIGDFTKKQIVDYDLVLMNDSLEHLPRNIGEAFLLDLIKNNHHVIVSVPDSTHNEWPQGAWCGNEYERHLAHWKAADLTRLGGAIIHRDICAVAVFRGKS